MRGARYGCASDEYRAWYRVALINDVGSDVSEDLDHSMDHSRVFLSVYSEFTGGLSAVDGAPPLRSEPWPSATVWLYTLSSSYIDARGGACRGGRGAMCLPRAPRSSSRYSSPKPPARSQPLS